MTNVNYSPIVKSLFDTVYNSYLEKDSVLNHKKVEHEVYESEQDFILKLFVPGYQKTDFEVKIEKNQLTISTLNESNKPENYKLLARTTRDGKIYKTFTLTDLVDSERISANYENGVLTFVIPKLEKIKSVRNIVIS